MIYNKQEKTITLNKEEITSLLNCLSRFKNVLNQPTKPVEELLFLEDFIVAKDWYNKLMYGE